MKYHIELDLDFKRNVYPGRFIALEGIDGSGKTLQAARAAIELTKHGTKVWLTKNPTDGEIGKFIRRFLSGEIQLPEVSFQYIYSADRQVQQVELLDRLKRGETVITDRYFWSALAYGVADRHDLYIEDSGNLLLVQQSLLSHYHQFVIPDITFFLDISVETALKRLQKMSKSKEIYETFDMLEKIKKGYDWLLEKFPHEFTVIDGEKSVKEVGKEIISQIERVKKQA